MLVLKIFLDDGLAYLLIDPLKLRVEDMFEWSFFIQVELCRILQYVLFGVDLKIDVQKNLFPLFQLGQA
jgi:hypothetical protein